MVKLCVGSGDVAPLNASRALTSAMLDSTIKLIQNEKFLDFVIKLTEKKLNALSGDGGGVGEVDDVYDPERLSADQVFKFLTSIWGFVAFFAKIQTYSTRA